MEKLLLSAINGEVQYEDGINLLRSEYSDDLDVDTLITELPILTSMFEEEHIVNFDDILEYFQKYPLKGKLLPNVAIVVHLLNVNASTSASPERTFSLARRLKTWQRSRMTQKRFSNLAILQEHKKRTDAIDLIAIGNEFVAKHGERMIRFGTFVESDLRY